MYTLINRGSREYGLPGNTHFETVVLSLSKTVEVTDEHFAALRVYPDTARLLASGTILAEHTPDEPYEEPPSAPIGEVEMFHQGGGWWHVYVGDVCVTDKKVKKARAEEIMAEYD
jgi:hypothetical protein